MTKEFKVMDELVLQEQIKYVNDMKEIDFLNYSHEWFGDDDEQYRCYSIKFLNENEECYLHLTDVPFKVSDKLAVYYFLWQTLEGRFFTPNETMLNSVTMSSKFNGMEDLNNYIKRKRTRRVIE